MNTKTVAMVLAVALAVIVRPVIAAQWATNSGWTVFTPPNDVSFTISTDRPSYARTDPVTLKYEILNVSHKPLYVPRKWTGTCPFTPHLMAWLEDREGRHSGSGVGSSCSHGSGEPPPEAVTERMKKDAVLLAPGEHFRDTWALKKDDVPPGVYRTEVELIGWNPA